jgi:hypothetical protein
MDDDLDGLTRDELLAEIKKLRLGIRKHRDSSGHDPCWFTPELWGLLPEKAQEGPSVPPWPEFMSRCAQYRASLEEAPTEPVSRITPRDRKRFKLGFRGLTLPNAKNREEALVLLDELGQAMAAMQSLDDLGPETNQEAMRCLDALQERYRQVKQQWR